jgi:hypothetical protein
MRGLRREQAFNPIAAEVHLIEEKFHGSATHDNHLPALRLQQIGSPPWDS